MRKIPLTWMSATLIGLCAPSLAGAQDLKMISPHVTYGRTGVGEYQPDVNTVLLLHMNEPSGASVSDASNFASGGRAAGTTVETGRFDRARSFNGSTDYIEGTSGNINFAGQNFTFEAWIKTSSTNDQAIVTLHDSVNWRTNTIRLYVAGGARGGILDLDMNDGQGAVTSNPGGQRLNDGRWHHVAATRYGDLVTLYVDGKVDNRKYQTQAPYPSTTYRIGKGNGTDYFKGTIDEVRLSNKSRLPNEFDIQLPPLNLSATSSGSAISLTWQNAGGSTALLRYKIYRGRDSTSVTLIDSTSQSTYSDASLQSGQIYFYRVSAVDVTGFESATSWAVAAATGGLLAAYDFSGNANDVSGNGFNGTVYGATPTTDRFGTPNSAFSFNGISNYIRLGNILNMIFAAPVAKFTITGWANTQSYPRRQGEGDIIAKTAGGTYGPYQWSLNHEIDGRLKWMVASKSDATAYVEKMSAVITPGRWFFYALIFDGSLADTDRVQLYVDGVAGIFARRQGTLGPSTEPTDQQITIGSGHYPDQPLYPNNLYNGKIDDIRIYGRVLGSSEMDSLYHLQGWPMIPQATPVITATSPSSSGRGTEFWVNIKVIDSSQVTNLFGISFDLLFSNTNYIDFVTADTSGCYLGPNLLYFATSDETGGKVSIGLSRKSPASGVAGSGTLLRLKFRVSATAPDAGSVTFSFANIIANDPIGARISFSALSSTTSMAQTLNVWPGDTDTSGTVNQADILPIGIHWGKTGSARVNASTLWNAQPASPWFVRSATYADANGDGIVNQSDVLPIGLNWGKVHSLGKVGKSGEAGFQTSSAKLAGTPTLRARAPSSILDKTEFDVDISIGDTANPVLNLFGIAFVLDFSDARGALQVIQSAPTSLLGDDIIFFPQTDNENGSVAFALTRKGGTAGFSGFGTIATLKFKIVNQISVLKFTTRDIMANNPEGGAIPVLPFSSSMVVWVEEEGEVPGGYSLEQNYPNPFNPSTRIAFSVPVRTQVRLDILDVLGRPITSLVNEEKMPGSYVVEWQAGNLPNGVYLCCLRAGTYSVTRKMLLLK